MDKNYYQTLGIKRNATQNQIADNFRKLSLVWHPKLSKQDHNTSEHHFSQICEAYDVLSDPVKKAYYDKHGWRKLTNQLYKDGGLTAGYKYGNNSYQIFDNFFSSVSALGLVLDKDLNSKGSMFNHAFGGLLYKDDAKHQDLVVIVPCSLASLYKGQAKQFPYQKKSLNMDGKSLSKRHCSKLLQIKPGYGGKTVLRFKEQGNETIERKSSDLIFKIVELPNQHYSRNGNDLIYTAQISLAQAISCQTLQIITLDNRKLRVSLDQIPNPQHLREVEGQGMPILDTQKKGNLYIRFDIQFPKHLSQETKAELRKLLS